MTRFVAQACLILAISLISGSAWSQQEERSPLKIGPDRRVQVYRLETVELRGSTRISTERVIEELSLLPGTPLNDTLVMETRSQLLSLGLFRSVILVMRKGSKPGLARLVIEVEDDEGVLTDWAIGGELGVTVTERNASTVTSEVNAPMDYRLSLIGRNLFHEMHRGSLIVDFDSEGEFRQGQLAYGLPRFTREGTQFDTEIAAVDVTRRYLDALGFAARGQGLWTSSLEGVGQIQYGAAMYVNKQPRFAMPGFPKSVAGPKVAYFRETRLRGFLPGSGHLIGASLLFAPMKTEDSVMELNLAKTFDLGRYLLWTLDLKALTVGTAGSSVRTESRFDVPLGNRRPDEDQAELFLRLRGGSDNLDNTNLVGSAAVVGVRYHSSGFIAELAVKVTRSPEELTPRTISEIDMSDRGDHR